MQPSDKSKVTCHCPSGHKIRGEISLTGERVKCPACKTEFTFGVKENPTSVSDTGVMRILGDLSDPAMTAFDNTAQATIPCGRCGVAIDEDATVCKHCNTYVSKMPAFLRSMLPQQRVS